MINPLNHGGWGRCTPLPPFLFAFYSELSWGTHTWKFLTLQTFLLRMPQWKKKIKNLNFEKSVQKPPVLERIKRFLVTLGLYLRILILKIIYLKRLFFIWTYWSKSNMVRISYQGRATVPPWCMTSWVCSRQLQRRSSFCNLDNFKYCKYWI